MKALFFGLIILTIPMTLLAQQNDMSLKLDRDALIKKSKNQKTTAFMLLGGGAAAVGLGAVLFDDNFVVLGDGDDGAVTGSVIMMVGGSLAMLGSIPFFISSANNKQKAIQLDAGFKMEGVPKNMFTRLSYYPSVGVKVKL